MKTLVIAALSFVFSLPSFGAEIGKAAPAFKLLGADGKTYSLAEAKGKTVVLEWYNKDCPYVKKHYGTENMQKLQKKYVGKKVVWYSIISSAPGKDGYLNASDAKENREVAKVKNSATLLDPTGEVGRAYDAKTTPHMFVIDSKGNLVYQGAIDNNSSANPKTVLGAKNYVAAALDAVLAGKPVKEVSSSPYGCSVKYGDS